MTTQQFLQTAPAFPLYISDTIKPICGRTRSYAVCRDGYTLSIQNAPYHHANEGTVEVAVPDREVVPELSEYAFAEGNAFPQRYVFHTIYHYLPIDVLERWLQTEHGGITGWSTQPDGSACVEAEA